MGMNFLVALTGEAPAVVGVFLLLPWKRDLAGLLNRSDFNCWPLNNWIERRGSENVKPLQRAALKTTKASGEAVSGGYSQGVRCRCGCGADLDGIFTVRSAKTFVCGNFSTHWHIKLCSLCVFVFQLNLNKLDCFFLLKVTEFSHLSSNTIPHKLCSTMRWERVTVSLGVANQMFQTILIEISQNLSQLLPLRAAAATDRCACACACVCEVDAGNCRCSESIATLTTVLWNKNNCKWP